MLFPLPPGPLFHVLGMPSRHLLSAVRSAELECISAKTRQKFNSKAVDPDTQWQKERENAQQEKNRTMKKNIQSRKDLFAGADDDATDAADPSMPSLDDTYGGAH